MRARVRSAFCAACLFALASSSAHPAAAEDREAGAAGASASGEAAAAAGEARRHFKLGIRLYQDTNYPGALAEFQAAYAAKPGPGSLQNVALCQKALFRYREAATTLQELLAQHGGELSDGEKRAISDTISELGGLVGSIVVNVEPSEAKVTLDGHAVPLSELRTGVDVNVGEHTLVADLAGYARLSRVVSVASGQKQLPVELKLKATDGFLNIIASDPRAAIAVDGVTRAFHEWRGGVKPDTEHWIQVFREGYESFESNVSVGLGKTLTVQVPLGARLEGETAEAPVKEGGSMPAPPPRRVPRGYYGLVTLGVLGLGQHPLDLTGTRSGGAMGTLGVRAGYRLWAPVAAELLLDFGKLNVSDAKSGDPSAAPRKYSLNAARFGPNLRLMTTGKTLRFASTIGVGVVHHRLVLDPALADPSLTGGTASGYDPYFLLELGLQWSLGRVLLGAEVITLIDGATALNQRQIEGASKAFGNTNTLPLFGLGIHGGYSVW